MASASPDSSASSSRRAASACRRLSAASASAITLRILLGLAELDHGELVVEIALDLADRAEPVLERVALLHGALRFGAVVPEIGVFGLLVQLGEPRLRCIDVKDASSAARPTA